MRHLVVYLNGVALWSSCTAGRGLSLRFTAQSYAIEITGVEKQDSAPVIWKTPETVNEPDPDPRGPEYAMMQVVFRARTVWLNLNEPGNEPEGEIVSRGARKGSKTAIQSHNCRFFFLGGLL